jgi:hypothetical protein
VWLKRKITPDVGVRLYQDYVNNHQYNLEQGVISYNSLSEFSRFNAE